MPRTTRTRSTPLVSRSAGYELAEQAATLERLLTVLDDREREIVRLRFAEDLTQLEIGARVGVSQMHVSRMIRQIVDRLREAAEHETLAWTEPSLLTVHRRARIVLETARLQQRSCSPRFRAPYRGRSTPVPAWWGSFDLAVNPVSGTPRPPRPRRASSRVGSAETVRLFGRRRQGRRFPLVSVRTEGTSNAKSVMLEPSIAPMAARPPVLIPTHVYRTGADASDRAAAFVSDDARACRHRRRLHIRVALAALGRLLDAEPV